ncbi:hypothetical protein PMIN04_013156 [Paraphaeosphaeria minitans]|uniref:Uncharacterized protein n=1 Tax=Paraphaeosphaeria minitans TaxID=565426 RepID=A0A9P6G985_9PLEO|nr:hypothetical protein PMIN01_13555 [Paraphaeosphaeria minitans]KAF9730009.1 hypothetical protein PMIN01_11942 [Paraphaeosphaeria minitans]
MVTTRSRYSRKTVSSASTEVASSLPAGSTWKRVVPKDNLTWFDRIGVAQGTRGGWITSEQDRPMTKGGQVLSSISTSLQVHTLALSRPFTCTYYA